MKIYFIEQKKQILSFNYLKPRNMNLFNDNSKDYSDNKVIEALFSEE